MNDKNELTPETDRKPPAADDGRKLSDTPWTDDEAAASRFDREVARLMTDRERAEKAGRERSESRRHRDYDDDEPIRFRGGSSLRQNGAQLMGIFSRTRDIIAANFSDMIEKADDPEKMIRMIIVEMEETLVEVRAGAARTIADQKEMQRHAVKLERLQEDWADKAQLALSKGREDLARAALMEKRKATDLAKQLSEEMDVLEQSLRANEEDIAKLQQRLREARSRQSMIAARLESAENRVRLRKLMTTERVDEALARFEMLERRVDYAEGHADALGMAMKGEPSLAEQIEGLSAVDKVDEELEALKRSMGGQSEKKED
nr:phage shock protein PspA [Croceicoccus marinus]